MAKIRHKAAPATQAMPGPPTMSEKAAMDRQQLQYHADTMAEHVLGRHPSTAGRRKTLASDLMKCCDQAVKGG